MPDILTYDREVEHWESVNHDKHCRSLQMKLWEMQQDPMTDGEEYMNLEDELRACCPGYW